MKNGKRCTRKQKEFLINNNLNPQNWLVVKNCADFIQIINNVTGETRVFNFIKGM